MRSKETQPNFELFKVLYEHPGLKEKDHFRLLYTDEPGRKEAPKRKSKDDFKPIISAPVPGEKNDISAQASPDEEAPEVLDEHEIARSEGYHSGFEQGKEDGLLQGLEEGRKQGHDEGYKTGTEEARKQMDKTAATIISSLEKILNAMEIAWSDLVNRYEHDMLALICSIAERVVLAKVDLDDDLVKRTVLETLKTLPEPTQITLNIAPEDYDYIEMIKEDFFEEIKTLSSIAVISNSSITRGGCKIETTTATAKTDIESRLKAVYDSILKVGAP